MLDTNVLSELVRPRPASAVVDWVDGQDADQLVITSLTAAEIRAGVALLEPGRRQRDVERRMEALLGGTFGRRVLPFDVEATPAYARLVAVRRRAGRPIAAFDAQIAAICLRHDAPLATRNTDDFADIGLPLINPWDS